MSKTKHISEVIEHVFAELTANQLTKMAIEYFNARGYNVWRQNQVPVRGRGFIGKKGQSDLIGFATQFHVNPGAFFAGEVKRRGDVLSDQQKEFLREVNAAGGYGFLIEDDGKGWIKYRLYTDKK